MFCTAGKIDEPEPRGPARQGTIQTGASCKWSARCSAAASMRANRSGVVPGAGPPERYRGPAVSCHALLYQIAAASLIAGSRMTRNRHDCILPPLAAKVPACSTWFSNAFGTGSGFSRRMDRVVRMISNRSCPSGAMSVIDNLLFAAVHCDRLGRPGSLERISLFADTAQQDQHKD